MRQTLILDELDECRTPALNLFICMMVWTLRETENGLKFTVGHSNQTKPNQYRRLPF